MPEAEVSLRLAFHLLGLPGSEGVARVAIDGAQVKVGRDRIFPIAAFLAETGWTQVRQRGLISSWASSSLLQALHWSPRALGSPQ